MEIIKEKDKQLQTLELVEHPYEQLKTLLYRRSCERSLTVNPSHPSSGIEAEVVEAYRLNDRHKIELYTKAKSERKKHPGRNEIPTFIERKYIAW